MRKPGSASNSIALPSRILPREVLSSGEFERAVTEIRETMGKDERRNAGLFLNHMYYLLGWMVGDAGKEFSKKKPLARIVLTLCRKHPQNLDLGYFVMACVGELGVPWTRVSDGRPYKGEPHGSHRWKSYYSEVIMWLHIACLGLDSDEVTSYVAVRMRWLFSASNLHRLWFLRGIADSDGTVNIKNRSVVLTSHPNGNFFLELFESIGVRARLNTSGGNQYVGLRATEAMRIGIFNPDIQTHRGAILARVANARTYPRQWPAWLRTKVDELSREGLSASQIRDKILLESYTYIKLESIRSRIGEK